MNQRFLKSVPVESIVEEIRSNGYCYIENGVSEDFVEELKSDVYANGFRINHNGISSVYFDRQFYLTHLLACSENFYRMATSDFVFDICDRILGASYRLKAMRYYETFGGNRMAWHTDNKTDRGFAHIPGLIFIVYLEDVTDGEFLYVKGSQNWSGERAYSNYSDEEIEESHSDSIVSFKGPKGSMVIYDTYGIHKARTVMDRSFVRKSLFFQIDTRMEDAEPALVNTAYLKNLDARTMSYLGFGQPANYPSYPVTSINHLPVGHVVGAVPGWLAHRLDRYLRERCPDFVKKLRTRLTGQRTPVPRPVDSEADVMRKSAQP